MSQFKTLVRMSMMLLVLTVGVSGHAATGSTGQFMKCLEEKLAGTNVLKMRNRWIPHTIAGKAFTAANLACLEFSQNQETQVPEVEVVSDSETAAAIDSAI